MLRLLKLHCPGAGHWRGLSPSNDCFLGDMVLANRIGRNAGNCLVRFRSTHTNPSPIGRKKVQRKVKPREYAEMIVVTESSTSEVKAKVKKLRPNDIKMLTQTNLDLSELYKLKSIPKQSGRILSEHTYHNLADINSLPTAATSCTPLTTTEHSDFPTIHSAIAEKLRNLVLEQQPSAAEEAVPDVELSAALERLRPNAALQPEIVDVEAEEGVVAAADDAVPPKRKRMYDRRAREAAAAKTLAAYIETCVHQKNPQRGFNCLHHHRHASSRYPDKCPPVKNVNVYNAMLKGFAAIGHVQKLKEVLKIAEAEGAELNVQSYAAVFECLGRASIIYKSKHYKLLKTCTDEAAAKDITYDRIMNEAVFLYDQREVVLMAMNMHDKHYKPKYADADVQYENHLVNGLNHERQLRGLEEKEGNAKKGIFTKEMLDECIQKQIEVERNVYVTVKSIEPQPEETDEVRKYRQAWNEHLKAWREAALVAFNRDLAALTAQRGFHNYEPYMRSIPVKDFISIIVDEAQKIAEGSETYSPTVNMLHRDLGAKVYARYKVLKKQKAGVLDKVYTIHCKYCEEYAKFHGQLDVLPDEVDYLNPRQKWQWAEHHFKDQGATVLMDHQEWVPNALQAIGKFLYNIVMHDIKIDVNVMRNAKHKNYLPAFYTIFRNQGRIIKEEVKPHPVLSKLYRASIPETLTFPAYELPMVCPPIPWSSVQTGGYLVAPCDVVRLPPQAVTQKKRMIDTKVNQLYPSFDALNQLAEVPWKVNQRLLDVIIEVFKSGGSSRLDVPEAPSSLEPPPPVTADMDKSQKFNNFRQKLQHRRRKAEMYSLWCDCLYRLSLASHFKEDIFWLPHNMDFRGRVYPVPPHLNHLGSDLARSMLVFAEARPLGPDGLDWLKLHLVNLTGLLKRERVSDRLQFANEIMDKILDSADHPLTGKMWWADSEEPWQTLACCMEIAKAHRSDDPEKYMCHFPVHQDGSCNGLQHYAALGRDSAGAFSVNLSPATKPQDVYSAVAALVEERRERDARDGLEIAKTLAGFVKRKVIKQTVMTTVYGVTRFGARLQIAKQLKDLDDFPKDAVWAGSSYLTGRTFDSLRSMFTSTREIQDWFTECARLISSVGGQNVEWVTPMGLPVVQPYFRYRKPAASGSAANGFEVFHMDTFERPNVMKQKNAFPPNFIHSLDSSHMMLTSLHCERAGITFVSVHDCYWTHPSTVHIMNKVCREQFVALHSEPILEDLSMFLTDKYSYQAEEIAEDGSVTELTKKKLNRVLRKLPKTGEFNIKEVLDSVYFFS